MGLIFRRVAGFAIVWLVSNWVVFFDRPAVGRHLARASRIGGFFKQSFDFCRKSLGSRSANPYQCMAKVGAKQCRRGLQWAGIGERILQPSSIRQ